MLLIVARYYFCWISDSIHEIFAVLSTTHTHAPRCSLHIMRPILQVWWCPKNVT